MANTIDSNPLRALDANGSPVSGARLYIYNTGTTTQQTVYSDSALTTPLVQPIVADSNGAFVPVYHAGTTQVRVTVTDTSGNVLPGYPIDPAQSIPLSVSGASQVSFSPTVSITSTTVQAAIEEVFADSLQNLSEDETPQLGGPLDANSQQIRASKGVDVASAAALTLGDDGNAFDVTGTTAITSIVTKGVGTTVVLQFDDALTLTHHATDLILPTGANITTAAGDIAVFYEYATGDWRCISYQRANGQGLLQVLSKIFTSTAQTITSGGSLTLAHGMGTTPKLVQAYLKCTTTDLGYSVGDEVFVSGGQDAYGSTVSTGVSIVPDATNLNIRFGSNAGAFALLNKGTGTLAAITNGSWEFHIVAWA
jgi:hypothetical protein